MNIKQRNNLLERMISWFAVLFYIILFVMFLDVLGINPDIFITKIASYLSTTKIFSIGFWLIIIGGYFFGYIIPYNIQEAILSFLSKKKFRLSFKPFYSEGRWNYA